tara:strand:- start:226 stop:816 length:591 start_codon:yes stop_codon:yes gene_type:complete
MQPNHIATQNRVSDLAARLMSQWPLFLDTETTGLGADAEICEIAIIDYRGRTCLDRLIKPSKPIPPDAEAIHGIANKMVETAPSFDRFRVSLIDLLRNRVLIVYNLEYDMAMMAQSFKAHGVSSPDWRALHVRPMCAMKMYADYFGDFNDDYGTNRWVKLSDAAEQCGLELPEDLHRARADAELTLGVMKFMARRN